MPKLKISIRYRVYIKNFMLMYALLFPLTFFHTYAKPEKIIVSGVIGFPNAIEITFKAPKEINYTYGREVTVDIRVRAIRDLNIVCLLIYFYYWPQGGEDFWYYYKRITIVEDTKVSAGWTTHVTQTFKVYGEGPLLVKVWLLGESGRYDYDVTRYFALTQIHSEEYTEYYKLKDIEWKFYMLNITYTSLLNDYNKLQNNYNELQNEYNILKQKYDDLTTSHSNTLFLLYISTIFTIIFLITTIYYARTRPKPRSSN